MFPKMKDLLLVAIFFSFTVSATAFWSWGKRCPIKGQVYTRCAQTICPATCDNPIETCRAACRPGCACRKGFLLDTVKRECVHPGKCPTPVCPPPRPDQLGICAELCSSDDDCRDGKCCFNGCGHVCTTVGPPDCSAVSCLACAPGAIAIPPPPDICCGSCRCNYNGVFYKPGDTFPADDGCNECTCGLNGLVSCTERACPSRPLVCPPVRPGQIRICVERCSHDSDCNGDEKCCSNGCGHVCTTPVPLDCSAVSCLACAPGAIAIPPPPDSCCGSCHCKYSGQVHKPRDTFPADDGCNTCTCGLGGHVACTKRACPTQASCVEGGNIYQSGESWNCSDGCNTCWCYNGRVASTKIYCGSCRLDDGTVVKNGETVYPDTPCIGMSCFNGHLATLIIDCFFPLDCENPITKPGECCSQCPTSTE